MKNVDYTKLREAPDDYVCSNCGVYNVKLWREWNTFAPKLFCALCAARLNKVNIDAINEHGRYTISRGPCKGEKTDQIGGLAPAIPDEEDIGYWGYTSIPEAGVNWWYSLPTKQ